MSAHSGMVTLLTYFVSSALARTVDMAPKMKVMAACPAQQRSFLREATRFADAIKIVKASSGPLCLHQGTCRMMLSVDLASLGKYEVMQSHTSDTF